MAYKRKTQKSTILLTEDNYYSKQADIEYMSCSQFKQFNECPAKAMAIINGEWENKQTESMLIGSFVDSWLDGKLEEFIENHPEIYNSRTGELKAGFKQAEQICNIIQKDEFLYKILKGNRQMILTGNIAGVKFKGKIDSLLEDCIVDGKVLKSCEDQWKDGEKMPFYKALGYDYQGAIYQTLYKQMYGKKLPFRLAVVTKEEQPDKRVFEFSDETIDLALQEIIAKAPVFDRMKKGKEIAWNCCVCDYCKSIKQLNENSVEVL